MPCPGIPAQLPVRVGSGQIEVARATPSVSVCLPAYNEQASIRACIEEAHRLLSGADVDFEIIVCDDGSRDATAVVAEATAAELDRVRVIRHPRNAGIRATFEELYAASTKDVVFLNSVDGQWPMRLVVELLPLLEDHDVVIASRRDKHYGWGRALVSWLFNAIPRLLFGTPTHDAGAVKLVRRHVLTGIPVISRSPFNEAERLIRARRAGFSIVEYPVDTRERQTGSSHALRPRVLFQAGKDVFRVWWSLHAPGRH